jgi:uncharacterized membrane protein YkvA (DUF1232 family)
MRNIKLVLIEEKERRKITMEELGKILKNMIPTVTRDDLTKILEKSKKLPEIFAKNKPLKEFIDTLELLLSLIKDYTSGKYQEIPWKSIAAIIACLLYVLNPLDIIPDFIPVTGYIDDMMVVKFCNDMIKDDLKKYKEWKEKND